MQTTHFKFHDRAITHARRSALAVVAVAGLAMPLSRDAALTAPAAAGPDAARADLASSELQRAAGRAELCSAANAVGVGLQGEYFARESWHGAVLLKRIDATVNLDASLEWPQGQAERPMSVRWKGWIRPTLSGSYRFHVDVPGTRMLVSQQEVVGPRALGDARIELAAGRYYPISIEIASLASPPARIRLEWTAPHGARYVVPRALLYLPTDSIAPAVR